MKPGDILLVKFKFDIVGWLIRRATKSQWNHVALAINDSFIIEGKGRGIIKTSSLKYIWNPLYKTKAIRVKGLKKPQIKKVVNYAKSQVGKSNYFKWLICIILLVFKYKKPLPRTTCSGLIAEAFNIIGFKFRGDKQPYEISPADIANAKGMKNVSGTTLYSYSSV